jgi:flagellin-like protein
MICKRSWCQRGVSPVIATILMVAITVVLAAVLYVMVIGLGGSGGTEITPGGSWTAMDPQNNNTVKLIFGSFTSTVAPMDLVLYLRCSNDTTTLSFSGAPTTGTENMVVSGYNSTTITATYTDNAWSSNSVNGGDYITVTGLDPGKSYSVEVFHYPSESIVAMAGNLDHFQLQP